MQFISDYVYFPSCNSRQIWRHFGESGVYYTWKGLKTRGWSRAHINKTVPWKLCGFRCSLMPDPKWELKKYSQSKFRPGGTRLLCPPLHPPLKLDHGRESPRDVLVQNYKEKGSIVHSLLVSVWRIICENFNPNGHILAEIWMKI